MWAQNNPYTFNFNYQFNYSIPFSICHNTTKWKELFSLKGTTFMFLALIGWITGLTPIV
jgi:lipoprotein signal peptidase